MPVFVIAGAALIGLIILVELIDIALIVRATAIEARAYYRRENARHRAEPVAGSVDSRGIPNEHHSA